jgi:phosphate transport system substrate-binding protein
VIPKGSLNVTADPGLEPVLRQQQFVFESSFDSIKVNIAYKNEAGMMDDFRHHRAGIMLLARRLTPKEIEVLKADTVYPTELPIAYDAVALIGNKEFDDSPLDTNLLKQYFNSTNTDKNAPRMIFDNENESVVKYMLARLGYTDKVSPNVSAVQTPQQVIDYVAADKNAIGFIPYGLVADGNNADAGKILERIKILSLRSQNEKGQAVRVSANQSDIVTGDYPLTRVINAVMPYSYQDNLEWLFVNFLYKDRGARIFLKAGWAPVQIPPREINVNTSGLKGIN